MDGKVVRFVSVLFCSDVLVGFHSFGVLYLSMKLFGQLFLWKVQQRYCRSAGQVTALLQMCFLFCQTCSDLRQLCWYTWLLTLLLQFKTWSVLVLFLYILGFLLHLLMFWSIRHQKRLYWGFFIFCEFDVVSCVVNRV